MKFSKIEFLCRISCLPVQNKTLICTIIKNENNSKKTVIDKNKNKAILDSGIRVSIVSVTRC